MTVDDIKGGGKERLENHLKDDDFFGVTVHKEAILEFNSKSVLKDGKYNINNNYWESYSILSEIKRLGIEDSLSDKIYQINEEYKKMSEIYQKSKIDNKIPLN
jgi:hypothetical protein